MKILVFINVTPGLWEGQGIGQAWSTEHEAWSTKYGAGSTEHTAWRKEQGLAP